MLRGRRGSDGARNVSRSPNHFRRAGQLDDEVASSVVVGHDLAAQRRRDGELLGLDGRTKIVKAALQPLHRRAAAEFMVRSIDDFYAPTSHPCR